MFTFEYNLHSQHHTREKNVNPLYICKYFKGKLQWFYLGIRLQFYAKHLFKEVKHSFAHTALLPRHSNELPAYSREERFFHEAPMGCY